MQIKERKTHKNTDRHTHTHMQIKYKYNNTDRYTDKRDIYMQTHTKEKDTSTT
jgi:hypothetical protein